MSHGDENWKGQVDRFLHRGGSSPCLTSPGDSESLRGSWSTSRRVDKTPMAPLSPMAVLLEVGLQGVLSVPGFGKVTWACPRALGRQQLSPWVLSGSFELVQCLGKHRCPRNGWEMPGATLKSAYGWYGAGLTGLGRCRSHECPSVLCPPGAACLLPSTLAAGKPRRDSTGHPAW